MSTLEGIEVFNVPNDYQPEGQEPGTVVEDGWYWACQPGSWPDSTEGPVGPFETEAEAEADAKGEDWDPADEPDINEEEEPTRAYLERKQRARHRRTSIWDVEEI